MGNRLNAWLDDLQKYQWYLPAFPEALPKHYSKRYKLRPQVTVVLVFGSFHTVAEALLLLGSFDKE